MAVHFSRLPLIRRKSAILLSLFELSPPVDNVRADFQPLATLRL
jgi:hypothetical protein